YEPGHLGRIDPRTAHHDGGYRVSAAFLAYLTAKYDPGIVRKLNAAMREARYEESLFEKLTGKNLKELDDEWRATLQP
ncbi:MAG: basic secretory protein-like protein, partial [Isosphaeraceae bacterium]